MAREIDRFLEDPDAPPGTPRKVNVRFNTVKPDGRIVSTVTTIENLPPNCSVRDLQLLMYDHLSVSIRQPVELRYWGKTLDLELLLKDYAIKEHSEIQVVIKPQLPEGVPIPFSGPNELTRVRFISHKLQAPIAVEGVTSDMSVLDLKRLLQGVLAKSSTFLAKCAMPSDERTGTMEVRIGDQFVMDGPASAAGKGKGIVRMKRVKDGVIGLVSDAELVELKLEPEQMTLLFGGLPMGDETVLGSLGLANNERIYLDFCPPWESKEVSSGGGKAVASDSKKGGKKKK